MTKKCTCEDNFKSLIQECVFLCSTQNGLFHLLEGHLGKKIFFRYEDKILIVDLNMYVLYLILFN